MLNRAGKKALTTSSLRDARGAELKRRGIKRSIRIGRRRGISPCDSKGEVLPSRQGTRDQDRRAAFVRKAMGEKKRRKGGAREPPSLLLDFSFCRFWGNTTMSILAPFGRNSIFWLSSFFCGEGKPPFFFLKRERERAFWNKVNDFRIVHSISNRVRRKAYTFFPKAILDDDVRK